MNFPSGSGQLLVEEAYTGVRKGENLAGLISIVHLVSRIYIFADKSICLAITDLIAVKDADFDHVYHLFSRNQKKPVSEETGGMNPCLPLPCCPNSALWGH